MVVDLLHIASRHPQNFKQLTGNIMKPIPQQYFQQQIRPLQRQKLKLHKSNTPPQPSIPHTIDPSKYFTHIM